MNKQIESAIGRIVGKNYQPPAPKAAKGFPSGGARNVAAPSQKPLSKPIASAPKKGAKPGNARNSGVRGPVMPLQSKTTHSAPKRGGGVHIHVHLPPMANDGDGDEGGY